MGTRSFYPSRASNFELLRILAMLLVLVLHANFLTFHFPTQRAIHTHPFLALGQVWSEALAIVGVNVFILISGYFGIKARLKGMTSLLFQALFYTVGVYCTLILLGVETFDKGALVDSLTPLHRKAEWFLPTYLSLMLFAPLLNAFVQRTDERGLRHYLLLFFLIEFLFGFMNDQLEVKEGYSLFAFAGIYLVGRYLRLYPERLQSWRGRSFLFAYLGVTLAQSLALIVYAYVTKESIMASPLTYKFLRYVSPINMLASILLFLSFSRLQLQSKVVNWISASTLAVYLIHCNPYLIGRYTGFVKRLSEEHSTEVFIVLVIGFILAVFAGSILVDKLRLLLWQRVILPLYEAGTHLWAKVDLARIDFPEDRD